MRKPSIYIVRKTDAPLSKPLPYTVYQMAEFAMFCKRHNMTFNNTLEYRGAITQYFTKD